MSVRLADCLGRDEATAPSELGGLGAALISWLEKAQNQKSWFPS